MANTKTPNEEFLAYLLERVKWNNDHRAAHERDIAVINTEDIIHPYRRPIYENNLELVFDRTNNQFKDTHLSLNKYPAEQRPPWKWKWQPGYHGQPPVAAYAPPMEPLGAQRSDHDLQVDVLQCDLSATVTYIDENGVRTDVPNVTCACVTVHSTPAQPYPADVLFGVTRALGMSYAVQVRPGASILVLSNPGDPAEHWYAFAMDRDNKNVYASRRLISGNSFLRAKHVSEDQADCLVVRRDGFEFARNYPLRDQRVNGLRVLRVMAGGWLTFFIPYSMITDSRHGCVIALDNEYVVIEPRDLVVIYRRMYDTGSVVRDVEDKDMDTIVDENGMIQKVPKIDAYHRNEHFLITDPLAAIPNEVTDGMLVNHACLQYDKNGCLTITGQNNAAVNLELLQILCTRPVADKQYYPDDDQPGGPGGRGGGGRGGGQPWDEERYMRHGRNIWTRHPVAGQEVSAVAPSLENSFTTSPLPVSGLDDSRTSRRSRTPTPPLSPSRSVSTSFEQDFPPLGESDSADVDVQRAETVSQSQQSSTRGQSQVNRGGRGGQHRGRPYRGRGHRGQHFQEGGLREQSFNRGYSGGRSYRGGRGGYQ